MDCVDSSFFLAALWSGFMVMLVSKLDKKNGFDSGLKDIFSMPILSALAISVVWVFATFDFPAPSGNPSIGSIVQRFTNFIEYSVCSFILILNLWGQLLVIVALYNFANRYFPNHVKMVKDRVKLLIKN